MRKQDILAVPLCAEDAELDGNTLRLNHNDGFAWGVGSHLITMYGDWTVDQLEDLANMMRLNAGRT